MGMVPRSPLPKPKKCRGMCPTGSYAYEALVDGVITGGNLEWREEARGLPVPIWGEKLT